jgi:hypothetical protein
MPRKQRELALAEHERRELPVVGVHHTTQSKIAIEPSISALG